MIAHIAGVPVEEVLPVVVSGLGAALLVKVTSVMSLFRGLRRTRKDQPQPADRS
jgi:hypothetical protein